MSRISYSPILILCAFYSAGLYQQLPKPRMAESVGIRSKDEILVLPSANWTAFDVGLVKTKLAQPILQERELRVRRDGDDRVDIERWPNRSGGGISQQESGDAAPNEGDLVEQWVELRRRGEHLRQIRVVWADIHTEFA